jgi:hypothetical protein
VSITYNRQAGDPTPCVCGNGGVTYVFYRDNNAQMLASLEGLGSRKLVLNKTLSASDPTLVVVRADGGYIGCQVLLLNNTISDVDDLDIYNAPDGGVVLFGQAYDDIVSHFPPWTYRYPSLVSLYGTYDMDVISGPMLNTANGSLGMGFNTVGRSVNTTVTPFPPGRVTPVAISTDGALWSPTAPAYSSYTMLTAQGVKFVHWAGMNSIAHVTIDFFNGVDLLQGFGPQNLTYVSSVTVSPIDFTQFPGFQVDRTILACNDTLLFVQYATTTKKAGTVIVQFDWTGMVSNSLFVPVNTVASLC